MAIIKKKKYVYVFNQKVFNSFNNLTFNSLLKTFQTFVRFSEFSTIFSTISPQSFHRFNRSKNFTKVFNIFQQSFNIPLLKTFDHILLQNIVFHSFNTPYYYYYIFYSYFFFFFDFKNSKILYELKKFF